MMTETATAVVELPGLPPAPPKPAGKPAAKKAVAPKAKTSKPKPAAKKVPAKKKAAVKKMTSTPRAKGVPQGAGGTQGKPAATRERDAKVLAFVKAKKSGRTLAEISEKFGLGSNVAYLSLYRAMKADGGPFVEKVRDGSRVPRYVAING